MQGLSIQLLGRPRIELDGEPVTARIPVKGQALVYYVAALGRAQPRALLASLLWGGLAQSAARANLRLTLSRLRRVLGASLACTDGEIGLSESFPSRVDLHEFDSLAERLDDAPLLDLEAVAAGLRGEFLEGFDLDDASSFGDWVESERLKARRSACRIWARIADLHEHAGNLEAAIEAGRQPIRFEPWDEVAHERQMRRLVHSGRPLAAIAQYEFLRRNLAEELGTRPGARIEALRRSLQADESASAAPRPRAREAGAHERIAGAPYGIATADDGDAATQAGAAAGVANAGAAAPPASAGRDEDLAAIERRLADPDCRALVLLGPGGIGKTWLARAAAARASARFADGVVFVTLADHPAVNASEAEDRVVGAIAQALDLAAPGPRPTRQTLPEAVAERELLLVLDNAEYAREAVRWIGALLQRAPRLRCLLASRQRLALPDAWLLDVEGLRQDDAMRLFVRCARRVRSDFDALAEADAIRRICRLVGGSPLAIELAARRAHALSCDHIAARLHQSIDILGDECVESRHRSLRAVFDESWAAMDERLREAACRLSVFGGAFDVEAARAITGTDLLEMTALAGHCWLARSAGDRFAMHPLIRHYTRERASAREQASGREQAAAGLAGLAALRGRHALHYLERYRQRAAALSQEPATDALAQADAEVDELRVALAWALERAPAATLLAVIEAAWPYLQRKGRIDEYESIVRRALARPDVEAPVHGIWQSRLGHGRFVEGRAVEAAAAGARALEAFGETLSRSDAGWYWRTIVAPLRYARQRRRLGVGEFETRARHMIDSFCYVGQLAYFEGDAHKSLALCLRGLSLVRHAGPCAESACIAGAGAYMAGLFGLHALSDRLARRTLALARESGSPLARAHALGMTSLCRVTRGEWAATDENLGEAIELYRALGQPRWLAETWSVRGKALYLQGRLDEARRSFEGLDDEARRCGDPLGRHWATLGHVECGLRSGEMSATHALERLEDVRRFAAAIELSDPAEVIRQHGLSALFHLRAGHRQAAREATALAAALAARTRLCGFWALEGYSGAIEAALALSAADDDALATAGRLSACFDRLARHYPILRPRAAWAAASVAARRHGEGAALGEFGRACRLAERWHAGLDRMLLARA